MYRPKLGQNIYIVFTSDSITLDKVVMKGKDDFAVSMTFNELFNDAYRKPIRYDEYGVLWFTSLTAAKKAIGIGKNEQIVKYSDDYWEVVNKT